VVGEGSLLADKKKEVMKAEDLFRKRVAIGHSVSTQTVRDFLRQSVRLCLRKIMLIAL
jgi:hypothetical protein